VCSSDLYRYNGPGNGWDEAYSVVYGLDGNIYIAGWSYGSGTYDDFTVISLTTNGNQRWVYRYDGSEHHIDWAYALVYGTDGNIYAAGYVYANDRIVISLTPGGNERWVYRGDLSYGLVYSPIIYGADGNIYTGGVAYGYDLAIVSLTSSGQPRWEYRYNGPGDGWDVARSIVYGSDGNIYIAGYSFGVGSGIDFIVISLNPAIGIEEETTYHVPIFAIRNFGRTIEFSLSLPKSAMVPISFYDLSGERIFSFSIAAPKGTSHHQKDLSFLPSGIYFLKIDLDCKSIIKKCIVLK
jgi:hypothetical protein